MADKNKLTMRILVLVIALLLLAVLYAFVVRPVVTGYAINNYEQGYMSGQMDLLNNVVTQIQQTANAQGVGSAQFPVGENQVLVIQGVAQVVQTQAQPIQ